MVVYCGLQETYFLNAKLDAVFCAGFKMSHPSKQAWDAVIHMLTWLKEQRERGIKFSSDLNNTRDHWFQ